jgi:hypothetical protein
MECPACKATIRVEEPYDRFVAFRNMMYRKYTRFTPFLLLGIVTSGTVVGSGWYGEQILSIFAGPKTAVQWLGLVESQRRLPISARLLKSAVKSFSLALIGPSLIIWGALPVMGTLVSVPMSIIVSWAPRPSWYILNRGIQAKFAFLSHHFSTAQPSY